MIEVVNYVFNLYGQVKPFLNQAAIKQITSDFFSWIGDKVFSNKKSAQKKLKLIEKQKTDTKTISKLKANLEIMLEGNKKLQKELTNKLKEVKEIRCANQQKNTNKVSGDGNKIYQNINNSTIIDIKL